MRQGISGRDRDLKYNCFSLNLDVNSCLSNIVHCYLPFTTLQYLSFLLRLKTRIILKEYELKYPKRKRVD